MKYIVKSEEDWHALRGQYITASNAAILVGADPYSSAAKIKHPEPFNGNAYTFVGQMLESVVVNIVNKVLGTAFELYENAKGHKEFYTEGHLGATPDAHMNRKVLLECKTTQPKHFIKYAVVPPSKYLVQLIVQMMCTHTKEGYLAILSTDLTQKSANIIWPIAIFRIMLTSPTIPDILKIEADRFKKFKTFRVSSSVKQKVKILLSMCYEKVN
jgi:predicted phage-related endonuclease